MTGTDLQTRLQVAKQASFISGDELRRHFDGDWHDAKHEEGVAAADLASREAIHTFLSQVYPHDEIWGKGTSEPPKGKSFWVFDSLNGTENFSAGDERFATTVAWVENGQPVVGVVSVPSKRALYSATKGGGAFFGDLPLHVRANRTLADAVILIGLGEGETRKHGVEAIAKLETQVRQMKVREVPALDICAVAAGTADGFVQYTMKPWDWIAARLILEEAGGKLTDIDGNPMKLVATAALAASDSVFDDLRTLLAR